MVRTEAEHPLRGRSILIVEDDPAVRDVLDAWLERDGAETGTVPAAEPALRALYASRYDLLITDLELPGGRSGTWLLRRVRALWPSLPAIVVTGSVDGRDLERSSALADALLTKPLDLPVLTRRARALIGARA